MKKSSSNLKRLSLELGGKNPIIIFNDADIKKSLENVIVSFTHKSGQCCVGASRIFIEKAVYQEFRLLLTNKFLY